MIERIQANAPSACRNQNKKALENSPSRESKPMNYRANLPNHSLCPFNDLTVTESMARIGANLSTTFSCITHW